ncbi:MarR family winged helix-turn-helix transcriptional regulator [Microbispora sp. ATCC PTA-5024]|uniref:MarR family winged helix-turn-helix transcriptional regulator n=1 Tax=Microbispora sp. ATCC PTA-5024 TaxID=316330 RepID=UPI0003DBE0C5|nr:MarR family winged helix-turn-helix transcriptional regulator [Microbispora sp. ATCC PTA-5024]ETK33315.1 MarR family transcriptional regulator [Microbispora sp. ATCC PTA-5024]
MNDVKQTIAFRLGTLGAVMQDRFAAKIETYDLKPKHVGLMAALKGGTAAASQQDLAARLGVAPSLVVALADHLEHLGAVERVRDPGDRRRQTLTLTEHGVALLARCAAAAGELDDEITASLAASERTALRDTLGRLAAGVGLPS